MHQAELRGCENASQRCLNNATIFRGESLSPWNTMGDNSLECDMWHGAG